MVEISLETSREVAGSSSYKEAAGSGEEGGAI